MKMKDIEVGGEYMIRQGSFVRVVSKGHHGCVWNSYTAGYLRSSRREYVDVVPLELEDLPVFRTPVDSKGEPIVGRKCPHDVERVYRVPARDILRTREEEQGRRQASEDVRAGLAARRAQLEALVRARYPEGTILQRHGESQDCITVIFHAKDLLGEGE